jgi:hypothetical protein
MPVPGSSTRLCRSSRSFSRSNSDGEARARRHRGRSGAGSAKSRTGGRHDAVLRNSQCERLFGSIPIRTFPKPSEPSARPGQRSRSPSARHSAVRCRKSRAVPGWPGCMPSNPGRQKSPGCRSCSGSRPAWSTTRRSCFLERTGTRRRSRRDQPFQSACWYIAPTSRRICTFFGSAARKRLDHGQRTPITIERRRRLPHRFLRIANPIVSHRKTATRLGVVRIGRRQLLHECQGFAIVLERPFRVSHRKLQFANAIKRG